MHMTSFTGATSLAASEEHINVQEYAEEVLSQHRIKVDESQEENRRDSGEEEVPKTGVEKRRRSSRLRSKRCSKSPTASAADSATSWSTQPRKTSKIKGANRGRRVPRRPTRSTRKAFASPQLAKENFKSANEIRELVHKTQKQQEKIYNYEKLKKQADELEEQAVKQHGKQIQFA